MGEGSGSGSGTAFAPREDSLVSLANSGNAGLTLRTGKRISTHTYGSERCFGVSNSADLAELLGTLARAFAEAGVRWYVFGAQAVVAYGVPRLTADVDVTVEYSVERVDELTSLLGRHGLVPRVEDVPAFAARTRVVPMEHPATGFPVDVVIAGPGLEEVFLARSRTLELGDLRLPFISPEDLLVSKVLAGRDKDREDVRGILRSGESLDLSVVRETLHLLDEALDRDDLVAAFDETVRAVDDENL